MKDELFDAQLRRTVGRAPYGGADLGECLATAERISGTNLDAWHDEWRATAERGCSRRPRPVSEAATAKGPARRTCGPRTTSATSGLFAMGAPLDQRLVDAHRMEVARVFDWLHDVLAPSPAAA